MSYVFISHTRQTDPLALALSDYLTDKGLGVWRASTDIPVGVRWDRAVARALDDSDSVVLIIEPGEPSASMRHEWSIALERWWTDKAKILLPVLVDEAVPPPFLKGLKAITTTASPTEAANTFPKILASLTQDLDDGVADGEASVPPDEAEFARVFTRLQAAIESLSADESDVDQLQARRGAIIAELASHPELQTTDPRGYVLALRTMSLLERDLGEQAEAAQHLQEALEIAKGLEEIDPSNVSTMLTSLGGLQAELEDYQAAIQSLEAALEYEREEEDGAAQVAFILEQLGGVYLELERYEQARGPLEECLDLNAKQLGASHPTVIAVASLLGIALAAIEDEPAETELYEGLLGALADPLKEPEGATEALLGLGSTLRTLGKPRRSREFLEKALASTRQQKDPRLAEVELELAHTFFDLGELDQARESLRKALETQGPETPPETRVAALLMLGQVSRQLGDLDESMNVLRDAVAEAEKDATVSAELYYNLGITQRESGDLAGAADSLRRAISIAEEQLGPAHPRLSRYGQSLDRILAAQAS